MFISNYLTLFHLWLMCSRLARVVTHSKMLRTLPVALASPADSLLSPLETLDSSSVGSVVLFPLFLSLKLVSTTKCPSPCHYEGPTPSCSIRPWRRSKQAMPQRVRRTRLF
ncbi:hypothetical protein AOLI_G00026780 [Acnodon oligacanthus]